MKKENNIWVTSDTHYGHENIIKYSQRPYAGAHEMNEALIANWNKCVQPNEDVYNLGDVAFCNKDKLIKILKRLNGNIHVILGNHDKVVIKNEQELLDSGLIKSIQTYREVKYEGMLFVLFHYPMRTWNQSHKNYENKVKSIHCFGHVHNKLAPHGLSLDVGVDSTVITSEYRPMSFREIIKWAQKRK